MVQYRWTIMGLIHASFKVFFGTNFVVTTSTQYSALARISICLLRVFQIFQRPILRATAIILKQMLVYSHRIKICQNNVSIINIYIIKIAEDAFQINPNANPGFKNDFPSWVIHKAELLEFLTTCFVLSIGYGPYITGRYLVRVMVIINYFFNFYLVVIRNGLCYLHYIALKKS